MGGDSTGCDWYRVGRKKVEKEINKQVKDYGLKVWKQEMEGKDTLRQYQMRAMPKYECMYDGSRGRDHLFCVRTEALGVNGRAYRLNERRKDKCFMCDGNEKETVEHLLTECGAYEREGQSMMEVIPNKEGEINEVLHERTSEEWMAMIVDLSEGATTAMFESVKRCLKNFVEVEGEEEEDDKSGVLRSGGLREGRPW
jgi:hypothetical protein